MMDRPFPYQGDTHSWQKPFEMDITDVVRFDQPNVLAVRVEVWIRSGGKGEDDANQNIAVLATQGQWQQIVIDRIIPNSDRGQIYLNLIGGYGRVWFDDVQLVERADV